MITTPKKSRPAMNQHSPGVYFVQTDLHGVITSVNDLFARSLGLSSEKLLNTFFPFYLENGWFIFEGIDITSLVDKGHTLEFEVSIFFNGRIIATQWFVNALAQSVHGPLLQWMGVEKQSLSNRTTVSEQRSAKKNIPKTAIPHEPGVTPNEEKERFLTMADTAPVMIWLSDENDKITYVNKCWIDFTGIRFIELSDNDWSILVHPADLPGLFDQLEKGSRDKAPLSMVYRLQHYSGEYRWVLANAVPRFLDNGAFAGYMGSVVDIHERKLAEEKIAFQANLIENVSDIIISTDTDFIVLTWNRTAEKIYGIPAAEAIGKSMPVLLPYVYIGSNADQVLSEIRKKAGWKGEVIFRNPAGNLVYLQSTVSGLAGEKDSIRGYVFVNRDVTDKVKAEESIKISEAFYRSLIGNSLNGIALTDTNGCINFVAPSVKNILGYEPEELVGTNIFSLVHPNDMALARERFTTRLQSDDDMEYIVIQVKKHDGEWLWCAIYAHNLLNHPYVHSMVIYFSDDSHRKGIERKLQESEIKFKSLFQSSLDIVNVLDDQFRITFVTPSIKVVMGYDEEEVIGRSGLEFIHPDDAPRVIKALEELLN
ncbi:MAG: PAS domain-containing protein, partial [Bacteroidetes bacterium]|nr:PAS domain-containing protein [Bacteroidota bacterium]